jgi:membrane protease YdiL (CAAX protease family)
MSNQYLTSRLWGPNGTNWHITDQYLLGRIGDAMGGYLTPSAISLVLPNSWFATIGWAAAWTALMLAYSPVADRLATKLFAAPPGLGAFRAIQQSKLKLVLGIIVAWVLGGFLEEVVFRGVVVRAVESALAPLLSRGIATGTAVVVAAIGAGIVHWYQGPRAMVIIVQLSVLFGVLFVASGYDLWAAILCHGLYDTIAFVRFASGKSRYAKVRESA